MCPGDIPDDAAGDSVGGHRAVAGGRSHVPPDDVHAHLWTLSIKLRAYMHSDRQVNQRFYDRDTFLMTLLNALCIEFD